MANSDTLDTSKNQSSWGGKRPGAGRKPGIANAATAERAKIKQALQERIAAHADRILNAQLNIALGASYLYVIEKDEKGHNKRPELVTAASVIEAYLAGELDNQDDYYYITTERPDNRAIDSMFDRAFGKADQQLDPETGEPVTVQVVQYADDNPPA